MIVDVILEPVAAGSFVPANAPKPDGLPPPKTLGVEAPTVPNGEELDEAREANPELAKAEEDVCGLWLARLLPKTGLGDEFRDRFDSLSEEVVGDVSDKSFAFAALSIVMLAYSQHVDRIGNKLSL